jgi:hypothetical protein
MDPRYKTGGIGRGGRSPTGANPAGNRTLRNIPSFQRKPESFSGQTGIKADIKEIPAFAGMTARKRRRDDRV